ncbi:MAG TPA: hypothetical protein VGR37_11770 [Longimicrobiaceae bacterium]|nr:hypothetical protein [Longimicrobiaceae bacterium]
MSVETLRNAAAKARKAHGLRATAREIGMSGPGLQAFLDGTDPQPTTVARLTAWYLRTAAERGDVVTGPTARAAVALLVDFLPPKERAEALREIRRVLERQAKAAGVPVPDWVEELSE